MYEIDIGRLKRTINALPDDGKIIIEVTRNYGNRKNRQNTEVESWSRFGKVLVLRCTTIL